MSELWIYGMKNKETELVTAINSVTHTYYPMPSIIYGALEYRVQVTDNSELFTLINNINKIEGVMFTPERFTGMGLAINPDGTPWAEIGYANKTDAPSDITIPTGQNKTIFSIITPTVVMFPSHFDFRIAGGSYDDVGFRIFENDILKDIKTANEVNGYVEPNEWYIFQYKAAVGAQHFFVLKYDIRVLLYRVDVYNYCGASAFVENISYSLREL